MASLVIIDGNNFYHKAKGMAPEVHLTNFNYRKLCEFLACQKGIVIEYCVGEVKKRKRSMKLYSNQQSLFYYLEKQDIEVKKGYLLADKSGRYSEKGVDVRMALDILKGALKNTYDKCYILSSDTDLIPAIKDAKAERKEIIYIGFEGMLSKALKFNCTSTLEITKELLEKCAVEELALAKMN